MELCNDMDSVVKMWDEIIVHSPELDEKLQKCMIDRIDRILNDISSQNPVTLRLHYSKTPIYFRDKMKKNFGSKILNCLNHNNNWKDEDEQVTAIFDLLLNHEFDWSKKDFISLTLSTINT